MSVLHDAAASPNRDSALRYVRGGSAFVHVTTLGPLDSSAPMRSRRSVVVAFGGNAIIRSGQRGTVVQQAKNLAEVAHQLTAMIKAGWTVVLSHGNGPQVGNIRIQQEAAEPEVPAMPLDVCGAMSQGQIGYLFAQALTCEFARQRVERQVVVILTRCVVDREDAAFSNPTKPVGPFYDKHVAKRLGKQRGWAFMPDADRGFRRTVPSPIPLRIAEGEAIRRLAGSGAVVIACGGGGIPVVAAAGGGYQGVEAVIDKDLAACLLAEEVGASTLVLLTQVPEVLIHFGTPEQRALTDVPLAQLEDWARQGHFAPGSMGPKVQAVTQFLRGGGELAIITSPPHVLEALAGRAGTRVRTTWSTPVRRNEKTQVWPDKEGQ